MMAITSNRSLTSIFSPKKSIMNMAAKVISPNVIQIKSLPNSKTLQWLPIWLPIKAKVLTMAMRFFLINSFPPPRQLLLCLPFFYLPPPPPPPLLCFSLYFFLFLNHAESLGPLHWLLSLSEKLFPRYPHLHSLTFFKSLFKKQFLKKAQLWKC